MALAEAAQLMIATTIIQTIPWRWALWMMPIGPPAASRQSDPLHMLQTAGCRNIDTIMNPVARPCLAGANTPGYPPLRSDRSRPDSASDPPQPSAYERQRPLKPREQTQKGGSQP